MFGPRKETVGGKIVGGVSFSARVEGDDIIISIRVHRRNIAHLKQIVNDVLDEFLDEERAGPASAKRSR